MTNLADLREKLERARDVVRRATRGPWDFNHDFQWGSSSIHSATETRPVVADVLRSMDGQAHNDAEAAVAAVNFVREALPHLLDLLDAKDAREGELEALCERLKLEAQMQSGEARAHKSTVHECYQAATGGTGEPGNWHGAQPVRERIAELEAALEPFATFAQRNVGDDGWNDFGISTARERIRDWFGPSDFRAARLALSAGGGA